MAKKPVMIRKVGHGKPDVQIDARVYAILTKRKRSAFRVARAAEPPLRDFSPEQPRQAVALHH